MVSSTQTVAQIKLQGFIGHINFFMTNPVTSTNDIKDIAKCCIKSWLHLNLRPNMMLFGRLT